MGRALASSQTTNSTPYSFQYWYNPAGGLTKIQYPSKRQVSYGYSAAGQVNEVANGALGGGHDYLSGTFYYAHGGMKSATLGNGLVESNVYNARLQLSSRSLGSILTLGYTYGTSSTANNGNLSQQSITWQGLPAPINQYYTYDSANRLFLATETTAATLSLNCPDPSVSWCEQYSNDAYGNRTIQQRSSNLSAGATEPASISAANNRNNGTGWPAGRYDASGNVISDPGGGRYTYDAENRQTTAVGATYVYDGSGRRVMRIVCGSSDPCTTSSGDAVTTVYVYSSDGQLAAEQVTCNQSGYCGSGVSQAGGVSYLFDDHLGSTRVVTNGSGTATMCQDYYPYGGTISVGPGSPRRDAGGQTLGCMTPNWTVRQEYTGKERDAETRLDYFGARYMSSAQGRFTSPDPLLNSGRPWEPQSWNRHAYTLNNPLKFTDPTGLYEWGACSGTDKECDGYKKQFRSTLDNLKQARDSYGKKSREYKRLDASLKAYGKEGEKNGVGPRSAFIMISHPRERLSATRIALTSIFLREWRSSSHERAASSAT